jgi:hypothetical protein
VFYVEFSKCFDVFDYDGEFIKRIEKPYPNSVYYIDLSKIYTIRSLKNQLICQYFKKNLT